MLSFTLCCTLCQVPCFQNSPLEHELPKFPVEHENQLNSLDGAATLGRLLIHSNPASRYTTVVAIDILKSKMATPAPSETCPVDTPFLASLLVHASLQFWTSLSLGNKVSLTPYPVRRKVAALLSYLLLCFSQSPLEAISRCSLIALPAISLG